MMYSITSPAINYNEPIQWDDSKLKVRLVVISMDGFGVIVVMCLLGAYASDLANGVA